MVPEIAWEAAMCLAKRNGKADATPLLQGCYDRVRSDAEEKFSRALAGASGFSARMRVRGARAGCDAEGAR